MCKDSVSKRGMIDQSGIMGKKIFWVTLFCYLVCYSAEIKNCRIYCYEAPRT